MVPQEQRTSFCFALVSSCFFLAAQLDKDNHLNQPL